MLPPLLDASQTLGNTVGAVYLGVVGASILFGVTSLQTYWYYHQYPNDSFLHKISVAILWILDSFHLVLALHAVYHYLVTGFGNIPALAGVVWSLRLQVAINVVIVLIVQSLYTFRVWLLGGYHHGVLGYLVMVSVAGGFIIGIVLSYEVYTVSGFGDLDQIAWAIDSSLAASTSIDLVIASAMCYYLRKSKGRESRLNSRISTLMQYTVSSGVLTSACSMSALVSYILQPRTFVFLGLEFLMTKFYVNSFLAMLNARERPSLRRDDSLSLRTSHYKFQRSVASSPLTPPSTYFDLDRYTARNDFVWNTKINSQPILHIASGSSYDASPLEGKTASMHQWQL